MSIAETMLCGLIAAWLLTRLMSGLLSGMSANDPLAFVLIAGGLLCVALLVCRIPARRATRVDPGRRFWLRLRCLTQGCYPGTVFWQQVEAL